MYNKPEAVAAQGSEYSYHAEAARQLFDHSVKILDYDHFGDVVRASRSYHPGVGVIAIRTAMGTVDRSAAEIVRARPSALPTITGRVDIDVSLRLAGTAPIDLQSIDGQRIFCHAQKEAWEQCEPRVREMIPQAKFVGSSESIKAIKTVIEMDQPDHIAIGPAHAIEPLGAVEIGSTQVNPANSRTRFYALQRDPRVPYLDEDEAKTEQRTVISLAHPEEYREMDKVIDLIDMLGITASDFITFGIGDFTRHRNDQRRAGGIFEFEHDRYDAELLELCARINGLHGNDGAHGPFSAKILGGFNWFPEEPMDLDMFGEWYDSEPTITQSVESPIGARYLS